VSVFTPICILAEEPLNKEKRRLSSINEAFEELRLVVPTFPYEKRMTKIETLRLAIAYIRMLRSLLYTSLRPVDFITQSLSGGSDDGWYTSGKLKFFCVADN